MKDNETPVRVPDYLLEEIGNDYQLRNRSRETAIYINQSAAIIWEICDGARSAGEIKRMLAQAYPDAAPGIEADVDEALAMLLEHGALSVR